MAKINDWSEIRLKLIKGVKEVKESIDSTSHYDENGVVMIGTLKWKKELREWIDRQQDLIDNGPFREL